jgi:hypothetical protein
MVKCEYSSCGAEVPEDSFTRGRHWPCCGKELVSYKPVVVEKPVPVAEKKVEEKPKEKAPAKKKAASKKKDKK